MSRTSDQPDHPTGIEVPLTGARCSRCGTSANPPYTLIAPFPNLEADEPRGPATCASCYVADLRREASIGHRAATVLVYEVVGYSHEQIGYANGHAITLVEKYAKRARDGVRDAKDGSALARLGQYL